MEESKFQLFNLQDTLKTNLDEYFCYMEEISNIVVLTCPTNLDILLSRSNHIFVDGTFLHLPKYYDQLYTIHMLQNGINVLISLANCNFHFDYEISSHNAIKECFPNSKIMACRFHLGQNWFRKIQSNSDLLKENNSKSEIGLWLKCFFALGFLPENLVGDGFSCLTENAPTDNFYFADYIYLTIMYALKRFFHQLFGLINL
ncbi:MULE domain-containing protein [Aphis craccivora]|uniref:MULE domain-containing protein n=1 Tax=Aphis craccivora TaxID=307492 RepID=A0A6G0W2H8_APHCR|nr:MULE domain-containing protein [Aphis craccivora]